MELEGKLERERANIAMLEQNLEKYNELTNQASKILTTFGNRLKKVNFYCYLEILLIFMLIL